MGHSRHAFLAVSLALFLVGASGACVEPKPPVIDYFWASPSGIVTGDSATLSWGVSDASTVTIDQEVGSVADVGTEMVSPTETSSYTLTAANRYESVSSSVVVTVTAPPPPAPAEDSSDDAAGGAGGDAQDTAREITLEDAPRLLDMSSDLPTRFESEDAAAAGVTIPDLGLGLEFGELTAFLSTEPMQVVVAGMAVVRGILLRVGVDVLLLNEDVFVSLIRSEIEMSLAGEGLDISDYEVDVDFRHPAIGDAAILGRGVVEAGGVVVGYEVVAFRDGEVVVFCVSAYVGDGVAAEPLASGIEARIEELRYLPAD